MIVAKAHISDGLWGEKFSVSRVPCRQNGKEIFGAVFIALFLLTGVVGAYSGGDGTAGSPYQISDGEDLILLSTDSGNWDKYFMVTNEIDLAGNSPASPIGNSSTPFIGSFDGKGHVIRNFEMNITSECVGLFGYCGSGGTISNLGVATGAGGVSGNNAVGGIVGYNGGTVTNCSVTEKAIAGRFAGGIVGWNLGTITTCSATGNLTIAGELAGGIVGNNVGGTISTCSATGNFTDAGYAGGVVGLDDGGTITNCSATGSAIDAGEYAGGLVGVSNGGSIMTCSATYSVTVAGDYAGGLVGFSHGASIANCFATGSVTAEGAYAGGLVGRNNDGASIANCSATGNVTAEGAYAGGLVGSNNDGAFIANCSATGNATAEGAYAGGLVGWNDGGSITDCYGTGNVAAAAHAGGLVGWNDGGSITDCSATGNATAGGEYAGGLVGASSDGSITTCSAMGNVVAAAHAGGLAGVISRGSVTKCSAAGSVTAGDNYAGGLVGYTIGGIVTNCYATGNATAGIFAGGLFGYNNGGTITTCYATGNATADDSAGGLVGINMVGTITTCYATGNATAVDSAGGLVGNTTSIINGFIINGTITNCYRHYSGGENLEGTYVSCLTTFRDIAFLTGDDPDNGLNWSTDIVSTDADSSKVWRAFPYKGTYPVFQWQSYDTGSITVTSSPSGANISLNGVATGRETDTTVSDLPEGEYTVIVSREGYTSTPENVSVTLTGGGTEEVSFVLIENVTTLLDLSAGWNMISVPARDAAITLPPEAGAIYRYNGNVYESVSDLGGVSPGEGVWMAATGACTVTFTGIPVDGYTENASAGWNMIGSCSSEIAPFSDHLSSVPAGVVSGQIYGYDPAQGQYVTPASCTPGCGYWVSVTEGCEICLSLT